MDLDEVEILDLPVLEINSNRRAVDGTSTDLSKLRRNCPMQPVLRMHSRHQTGTASRRFNTNMVQAVRIVGIFTSTRDAVFCHSNFK